MGSRVRIPPSPPNRRRPQNRRYMSIKGATFYLVIPIAAQICVKICVNRFHIGRFERIGDISIISQSDMHPQKKLDKSYEMHINASGYLFDRYYIDIDIIAAFSRLSYLLRKICHGRAAITESVRAP